jgi:HK97 family phage prohead protease
MEHENRAKLIDVRETRKVAERFEFREDDGSNQYVLEGYAATWDPYDCYGGPERGGWVEQLTQSALNRTLSEQPDVMLLINHEGLPLARTKSGNLALATDHHGLRMRALLDATDPDVQRIAPKMRSRDGQRPLLDEMSFSFRVKDQVWNSDYSHRTITELSLQKGDVSVVNYGMNPGTRAVLSTDAVGALARMGDKELVEMRGMEREELAAAMQALQRAWRASTEPDEKPGDEPDDKEPDDDADDRQAENFGGKKAPPFKGDGDNDDEGDGKDDEAKAWVNFDGSHLLYDGQCVTCAGERAKPGKYGAVKYADPGYLDGSGKPAKGGNGVPRYPIDAKHVQAAWSYINMPKNQKGYTASQLASIKSKIKTAMKAHGHDVSEDKKSLNAQKMLSPDDIRVLEQQGGGLSHVELVRKFGGGYTLMAIMHDGTHIALPSFRQSSAPVPSSHVKNATCPGGEDCPGDSCPVHGDGGGRARTTDNSGKISGLAEAAVNIATGAQQGYDWQPDVTVPQNQPYTKQDLGGADPGELHGKAAPEPSPQVGSGFRDIVGQPKPTIDAIHDDETPQDEFDEKASLSVDTRLRELRRDGDLPNRPTVDQAFEFLRQLA